MFLCATVFANIGPNTAFCVFQSWRCITSLSVWRSGKSSSSEGTHKRWAGRKIKDGDLNFSCIKKVLKAEPRPTYCPYDLLLPSYLFLPHGHQCFRSRKCLIFCTISTDLKTEIFFAFLFPQVYYFYFLFFLPLTYGLREI